MNKNRIVVTIHSFILEQEIMVYQNNKCIKVATCPLAELENTIVGLVKEFNIATIDLIGCNQAYGLQIKNKLISKYAKNDLEIIIH